MLVWIVMSKLTDKPLKVFPNKELAEIFVSRASADECSFGDIFCARFSTEA